MAYAPAYVMLTIIRNFLLLSGISALAVCGYIATGYVFLLLTAAWFAGFAIFSTFSPSKYGNSMQAMVWRTGFIPPAEGKALLLTMGVFSFVANFAIQPHWFLLAHGTVWTLIAVANLLLRSNRVT